MISKNAIIVRTKGILPAITKIRSTGLSGEVLLVFCVIELVLYVVMK